MDIEAQFRSAVAAHLAGDLAAAETGYRALVPQPNHFRAAKNLGAICVQQFRWQEALDAYRAALSLEPTSADALFGAGAALTRLSRLEEAETALRQGLSAAPHSDLGRYRLACCLLAQERFSEAWPLWESRPTRTSSRVLTSKSPEWRGESLRDRSILVWGEQGLGDEIQAARFISHLREQGASKITVACLGPNLTLFQKLGADVVFNRSQDNIIPRHDYWTLLWSVPFRLSLGRRDLWRGVYLPMKQSTASLVGFVAQGNAGNPNDRHRSISPETLRRIVPEAQELSPRGDMTVSLEQLASCGLVISVDTSWAHLAAAAGLPTWVLLSRSGADWRWRPDSETSPWYPNVRLFWQRDDGDWSSVLRDVSEALSPIS